MKIIQSKCSYCLKCKAVCLFEAVTVSDGRVIIDESVCFQCGVCKDTCPMEAIFNEQDEQDAGMQTSSGQECKGICLYLESRDDKLSLSALQVIGAARRLQAQSDLKIYAILIGEHTHELASEFARYGVDELWFVEQQGIGYYAEDLRIQWIAELLGIMKPEIVLAGGLRHARSIMAGVAARLHTGLCADCIDVHLDSVQGTLVATRTAFGGSVMASIHMPQHRPQMATLKEGAFEPAEQIEGFCGQLKNWSGHISTSQSFYEVLEVRKIERWLSDFTDSDVIVAVGRGIGKAENLPIILSLAEALGAKVGATRAVVEAGWLDVSHQIGQSGKVVKPRVYIACGISGALQHIVGMEKSATVIAINTDRNAPIFQYASYGFVGELEKIIPRITEYVKGKSLTLKS
ncbi:electron transfer flavoprotein subunit alpha [Paenibacillus sp. FSL R7-0179]|uniref:electron transfer flavoprotein subunit alpha n=2 Tax=Paenibacillus TaxID=44249 RepID=UPI0030F4D798